MSKETYTAEKEKLSNLSLLIRPLVQHGQYLTINDGLIDWYKKETPGVTVFNTFESWKRLGYTVKKGEHAYKIWSQKRTSIKVNEKNENYTFFSLTYLFSNLQVFKPAKFEISAPEPTPEQEPEPTQEATPEPLIIDL